MLTHEQKKYRDRANRARRELFKEKEQFGAVSDGSGKRYRVCVYFVLSDAPEKAVDFLDWFEQEFPDDMGEPTFFLYAALAHYRIGSSQKAQHYLLNVMLSNIYMLPYLFLRPIPMQNIWHSSNLMMPDYLYQIDDFLEEPTSQEREWMKVQYDSEPLTQAREKYMEIFGALQHANDIDSRSRLLNDWYRYLDTCQKTDR